MSRVVPPRMAYVNTSHPDFVQAGALRAPPREEPPKVVEEAESEVEKATSSSNVGRGRPERADAPRSPPVFHRNGPKTLQNGRFHYDF